MVPHADMLFKLYMPESRINCRHFFSLFVLSKSGIYRQMMLLQLIVFRVLSRIQSQGV